MKVEIEASLSSFIFNLKPFLCKRNLAIWSEPFQPNYFTPWTINWKQVPKKFRSFGAVECFVALDVVVVVLIAFVVVVAVVVVVLLLLLLAHNCIFRTTHFVISFFF